MSKVILFASCLLAATLTQAATQVGDTAPNWELQGSDGNVHSLAELRGQYVVIAFFPKAFTSG